MVLFSWVRCSLFGNRTLNSLEEVCWCESFHCPLEEQRVKRGGDSGVGHGTRSEGTLVLDLGHGALLLPVCLLPFVRLPVGHGAKVARGGSAPRPRRSEMPSDGVACPESCAWSGVRPCLLEAGHPV